MSVQVLAAVLFCALQVPTPVDGERAWQQLEPYRPPDFEAYFPDDPAGAEVLDAHFDANTLRDLEPELFLSTVRAGLRRTRNHRTILLSQVGNLLIWGQEPQHADAIELCYHAADFSPGAARYGTRHYAVYFGLSVVKQKTPAILRTLAELCIEIDDPNDLGRVAWGAADQMDQLLPLIEPYLASDTPWVRAKAAALGRIFRGELGAFEWAAERCKEPPRPRPWDELPEVRRGLRQGTSAERLALLERIAAEELTQRMNESYIADFAVAATDPDPAVRRQVAKRVGNTWIWRAGWHRIHAGAVDLMLEMSRDPDPDVRHEAVYYGLSTYRGERDDVLLRLVDLALDPGAARSHGRILWSLERYGERLRTHLESELRGADEQRAQSAYALYAEVFDERPTFTPPGLASPADLVGTWVVSFVAPRLSGKAPLHISLEQDAQGKLVLAGDFANDFDADPLGALVWAALGEVLHFQFETPLEGALVYSSGHLEGGRLEGTSRIEGFDELFVWSAQRQGR